MPLRLIVTLALYFIGTVLGLLLLPSPLPPVKAVAVGDSAWQLSAPAQADVESQLAAITGAALFALPANAAGALPGLPPPPDPPANPGPATPGLPYPVAPAGIGPAED